MGMLTLGGLAPGACLVPEHVGIVEFLESEARIPMGKSSDPGRVRFSRRPYQRGILQACEEHGTDEVVMCLPSQMGKTSLQMFLLMFWTVADAGDTMWVLPQQKSVTDFVPDRLEPMVEGCDTWREQLVGGKRAITATKVKFAKSTVYFTLAASEAQLASRPVKRLILDEEDKFPRSTKNEGSPQDQAKRRTRTYRDAITIRASTPTRKRGPIWTALQRSDWRKWFVPCLTCGHYAPWEFSQVIFPERVVKDGGRQESLEEWAQRIDNGADAGYACAECGAVARGRGAQTEMNRRGEWRPTRVGNRGVVGFQTSSLTSPDVTWSEFAVRFLEAKAEERRGWPEKMRDFRLHDLAEPWEPARVAMEEDAVVSRTVALRAGIVPRFHRVLGVGIDCQDDRVYVVLMSGAPDPLSLHVVAYAELRGPLDAALAAAEDFAVDRAFPDESKESRMVNAALADSGDWHHQPVVYTWTSRSKRRFPLKGASKALGGGALVRRNTNKKADHKGKLVNVCPLGTGRMLDTLLAAPPLAQPGTGLGITFCAEAGEDEEFQRQVVSEEYDEDSDGYVMREGYLENHFRDACRYAMAALAVAGVFRGRGQGKRRAKMRPKWKPGAGGRR